MVTYLIHSQREDFLADVLSVLYYFFSSSLSVALHWSLTCSTLTQTTIFTSTFANIPERG